MIKYRIQNSNEVVQGATSLEVIENLRDGSKFDYHKTAEEYMRSFAYRYKTYSGHDIDFLDPEVFIQDLIRTGYLIPI